LASPEKSHQRCSVRKPPPRHLCELRPQFFTNSKCQRPTSNAPKPRIPG
jgi:hypothetical protein